VPYRRTRVRILIGLGRSIDQTVEVLGRPLRAVCLGGDSTDDDILHAVAF
jgi:hypothetical protein